MTVHDFTPARYHNTFGSHQPVLSIRDGDVVRTSTVDAAGCDASGSNVTPQGNPLTGPFFVEGAEPGDAVAVRINAITPNRRAGYGSRRLAPVVVDPEYVQELDLANAPGWIWWDVDVERWTAKLTELVPGLDRFVLPLEPMLGCIGVAPDRGQAISSATSGPYGGNMDYRLIGAGTTVCFPVFTPGALLFVGDCHAVQGAGEMTGTGVEISCDVEFEVRLLKSRGLRWPRGETDDCVFTIGNARPLDQATQHATTEMMRWLRDEYGLDATGASIVIGQCAEYDLGNMFDPAYTMALRLPKARLEDVLTSQTDRL